MQTNLTSGLIYKGSDAEITVSLFPRCMTVTEYSGLTVDFFTTQGGHSIHFDESGMTISGQTATVHLEYEAMEGLDDGLIRYNVSCTMDGDAYTMDMETRWYLKTPSSYTPQEFVSKDEVDTVVESAMTGYTKTTEFATVDGNPIVNGGNIPLDRVITLNSMIGEVTVTGTSGVTKDLKNKVITINVPTKTSELDNDAGFLTEHQELKTINNQSIVGSGNIEITGGTGSDVCVCYVYNDKSHYGDFDELYARATNRDETKPYVCYFVLGSTNVPATVITGYNQLMIYEPIQGYYITIVPVDGSFTNGTWTVTNTYMDVRSLSVNIIWTGTQVEYNNLGTYSDSTLYIIKG